MNNEVVFTPERMQIGALTCSIENSKEDVSINDDIKSWENFIIILIISGFRAPFEHQ